VLPVDLSRLRTLVADYPSQQARLSAIERLVTEKLDELAKTVTLRTRPIAAPALFARTNPRDAVFSVEIPRTASPRASDI
jgi:CHASE3 domain sensor protein